MLSKDASSDFPQFHPFQPFGPNAPWRRASHVRRRRVAQFPAALFHRAAGLPQYQAMGLRLPPATTLRLTPHAFPSSPFRQAPRSSHLCRATSPSCPSIPPFTPPLPSPFSGRPLQSSPA